MKTIKSCLSTLKKSVLSENAKDKRLESLSGLVKVVKPIDTKVTTDWVVLEGPRRLHRVLELYSSKTLRFFIDQLLELEDEMKHHAVINIAGTKVTVDVYTHSINDITDVDRDYASALSDIYGDSIDIMNRQNMLANKNLHWS
jgi:pterin-4a-carbinolamine dehydratase